jgi:hypothetical protein
MYMLSNVHAWTEDSKGRIPLVDWPGLSTIRESFAIGKQEACLELNKDHARVLHDLLASARPADLLIYEYALETLRQFLTVAEPPVVEQVRTAVARMISAVARASGKGWFGGEVSSAESACIEGISSELSLRESEGARRALGELAQP